MSCAGLSCSVVSLCKPMECSPPDSSVHGILQARKLDWVAMPSSRGIFPTQGSNPGLPRCRQIIYCLRPQGSPLVRLTEHYFACSHPQPGICREGTWGPLLGPRWDAAPWERSHPWPAGPPHSQHFLVATMTVLCFQVPRASVSACPQVEGTYLLDK